MADDFKPCSIDGCNGNARDGARGWCPKHYHAWHYHGDPEWERPEKQQCLVEGCENVERSKGLCKTHYERQRMYGSTERRVRRYKTKPKIECNVAGCDKPSLARGMCESHYARWHKTGDTKPGQPLRRPNDAKRFIEEVALGYRGEACLIWPFLVSSNGYAVYAGKVLSRVICEKVHGKPPTTKHEAAHSCGMGHRACIAPSHLSWKTRAGNHADKVLHGTTNRGQQHYRAKLTVAEVRAIRKLGGKMQQKDIAAMFGIKQPTVSGLINRTKWAWLD